MKLVQGFSLKEAFGTLAYILSDLCLLELSRISTPLLLNFCCIFCWQYQQHLTFTGYETKDVNFFMEDTVFLYVQGNSFFLFYTIYYFTILTSIFNVIILKTDTRTGFLHLKRLLVFYMVISLFCQVVDLSSTVQCSNVYSAPIHLRNEQFNMGCYFQKLPQLPPQPLAICHSSLLQGVLLAKYCFVDSYQHH